VKRGIRRDLRQLAAHQAPEHVQRERFGYAGVDLYEGGKLTAQKMIEYGG